ncbi:hypothetical protein AGDE_16335 [Angomonas deanei]|uniref:Ribosomal protein S36, mitochondrial, putative n=1 Tax=Angomonas deanei TaxID=59799 RepID=A0A7G2CCZ5_9TRYP|nr:hypothetical protein AGDE_16335 [Angomonas deanei]CAD2215992.1 Ribosomal protein S36, mitochondrial, putative [Angomonas deanei]|eukprot:EPY17300.1 hypothetical protein AGDE_16335 [Angomonas deanei]
MIKFTYALAKSGLAQPQARNTVRSGTESFAASKGVRQEMGRTIVDSVQDLPARFKHHIFSELEMETVAMGGVEPYVPKHLLKKKKKA